MSSDANKEESSKGSMYMEVTDLTVEDLVRIFNDPKGELLNYQFKPQPSTSNQSAAESFHMDVPYDAIKVMVNNKFT